MTMSDFPKRGDIEATRAWLEQNGFYGPQLTNWNAEALLGQEKEDIIFLVGNRVDGLRLWGLLNTARQTPSPGKENYFPITFFFIIPIRFFPVI